MKKAIWVVAVDNYRPDICTKTFPTISAYAKKIGASFDVIRKRRWNTQPTYEKLQVAHLGSKNDFNMIIDADIELPEDMFDVLSRVRDDRVSSWMTYDASEQFPLDEYFYRDGRKLGVVTSFIVVPKACMDALTPFDDRELPKRVSIIKRPFILDEYCISRNMARFGIKHSGILTEEEFNSPPMRHWNAASGPNSHTVV